MAVQLSSKQLEQWLAAELNVAKFRDYCPNGLQVAGPESIQRIVTGVTACEALIDRAIALKADAILVHHGYFWKGEDARVIGMKQRRLKKLLLNDINLFAYHLPLDAHPTLGNNAQLAARLGLSGAPAFAEQQLAWAGRAADDLKTVGDLAVRVEQQLGRKPLVIGDENMPLELIGWCTGSAQSMIAEAVDYGCNVFLSGEISEPTVHTARENNIAYLACGHHATERYAVQALGEHIAKAFGIEHQFVEIDNPV